MDKKVVINNLLEGDNLSTKEITKSYEDILGIKSSLDEINSLIDGLDGTDICVEDCAIDLLCNVKVIKRVISILDEIVDKYEECEVKEGFMEELEENILYLEVILDEIRELLNKAVLNI